MLRLVSIFALVTLASTATAATPALNIISPAGGQRGTELVVQFQGGRLQDSQEVLVYYPGITVTKLEANPNGAAVAVTLKIAPDCRLGEHGFRLRTASGVSDFRTFWVGALPAIDEKEPNTQFDTQQVVPMNVTVHGVVDNEDADFFQVDCKKGQRLSVEVEAMRLGSQMWDPAVAILDSRRFELAFNDDSALVGQDAGCSIVIPADGKYTVLVRDSSYGGNGACRYRLHIGNFPRPTALLPAGGMPGEEIEFRFLGDPAGEIKQKIKLPATDDPNFRLHCTTPEGINPTGFRPRLNGLPGVVVPPGTPTAPDKAFVMPSPGAAHGTIAVGENVYVKFPAKKGQAYELRCLARQLGSPLDPVLHVMNLPGGPYIAGNDDSEGGPDSVIRFTAPEDKEYVLWVHDHLKKGGLDYFFRLEVKPVASLTTTGIPKVDGNNVSNQDRQSITIPKGGRYATLVNVGRSDWGGPATVSFDKLPPGVTIVADPCDAGQGVVPVVLEAKADAALGGTLSNMMAAPADPKHPPVLGRTMLDINFNIGINNTPFHRHYAERVAVAVTEAAPYSIEVLEPKAPVPQNGSILLKVVAKRATGFKGPITVLPLFTPPGMGIQGSAVIPENATEITLNVNAAPNAAPRKWKTAVTAVGDAGLGPVWTSSQLFTLEVAVPFVAFAQDRAAVEQGNKTTVFAKVTVATPFEGKAIVKLIGLPAKAVTVDKELTKDGKEIAFEVTTDKTTPAGKHGLFCQVIVTHNGETLYHNVGGGELRVDVPLPPKSAAAAAAVTAPKPAAPPAPVAAKPLSRLEQLRKEQEEREKAEKAKPPEKPPEVKKP